MSKLVYVVWNSGWTPVVVAGATGADVGEEQDDDEDEGEAHAPAPAKKVAAKRSDREAGEGAILSGVNAAGNTGVVISLNCETDFVGKNDDFVNFAEMAAQAALDNAPADADALAAIEVDGESLDAKRRALVAKLGENITIRRFRRIEAGEGKLGCRDESISQRINGGLISSLDLEHHVARIKNSV